MKRILHVYPQVNCGGTEMVFFNLIKFGDRDHFQYELLTQQKGDNESAFEDLGVKIHTIPKSSKKEYSNSLIDFFKKEQFDVVHAHMHSDMPIVLKAAKKAGIICRAAHSHNARIDIPKILWPLFYFRHRGYEKYATHLFGCSKLALRWLFPSKYDMGTVIHNGIDLNKFRFNAEAREKLRSRFGINESTKVFINVGRCTDQKNQKYILELCKERTCKDELYIIIGSGPLLDALKRQKEEQSISNVLLLGKRSDVAEWLSAADVFLFPSRYEGLGIVAIEAQASGLAVIASETIPEEADMSLGNFYSIPLKDRAKWNELMSQSAQTKELRSDVSNRAFDSNYNIYNVTKKVEALYG